ncbi:MAG: CBS domain-containing protein, partial [Sphingomonadales bacterium]
MTIATILGNKGHEVVSVRPDAAVGEVVKMLAARRIGAVPVVEGATVVGILSERDLVYGLAADGAALLERKVAEVMTAPPIT